MVSDSVPTPAAQPAAARPPAQLGYAFIQLPSRGQFYDGLIPEGRVQQRKMLAREHALLQQQGGSVLEKIEAIVNACTKLPAGFSSKDLLLTDSFFLLLALRTQTFGPEYTYRYKCRFCGSVEKANTNIVNDLDERVPDADLREPFNIKLPDAACTVQCRFLRMSDQDTITRHVKRVKMATGDADDPSYLVRIALSLVSREGELFKDFLAREDFVKTLSAADCVRFDNQLQKLEPGTDVRVFPDCSACGATNEMALPLDGDFFRPTRL